MSSDEVLLVDLCLEFLEAFIHQLLFQREIYSPDLFERRRLYGIAVRRARHPELCEYIHDVVTSLKTALSQRTLAKVAIVVKSPAGEALERFAIEPRLLLPQSGALVSTGGGTRPHHASGGARTSNLDILELEAHLRAALLKLQYCDAALPSKPPPNSSFDVVIYSMSQVGLAPDVWVLEQEPLSDQGLEMKAVLHDGSNAEIVPIKSWRIEGAMAMQIWAERLN